MNAHRSLGLLAAVLITAGQALLIAVDTAAVAQNTNPRGGYESPLDATVTPGATVTYGASDGSVVG